MDFMSAIKAMKEGKKIKRKRKGKELCAALDGGRIHIDWSDGTPFHITNINFYLDDDWEVVEEKKTLSGKIVDVTLATQNGWIYVGDVKEALKEFIDSFKSNYPKSKIDDKAKEIFGEELLK